MTVTVCCVVDIFHHMQRRRAGKRTPSPLDIQWRCIDSAIRVYTGPAGLDGDVLCQWNGVKTSVSLLVT